MDPTPDTAGRAAEQLATMREIIERTQPRIEAMRNHVEAMAAVLDDCVALLQRIHDGETENIAAELGEACRRMHDCHAAAAPTMAALTV